MELNLLDNGIDSMKHALIFYRKYLHRQNRAIGKGHSELKMTVLCLENAIELLSKKVLTKIDDMLIYRISDPNILNLISDIKNDLTDKESLDEYLIGHEVFTIDYKDTIKVLKARFNIDDSTYEELKQLGYFRNKITHFGINRLIDFYEIIGIINRTYDFIIEFFYPQFRKEINKFIKPITYVIEIGEKEELEAWNILYAQNFEVITCSLRKACEDIELIEFFRTKGFIFNLYCEYSDYYDIGFDVKSIDNPGDLAMLLFESIPRLNATIICGEGVGRRIFAVIDHNVSRKNFYIYSKPFFLENDEQFNKKFWGSSENCRRKELKPDAFKEVLKEFAEQL